MVVQVRNFTVDEDDVFLYSPDENTPYFMETTKIQGRERFFAAYIVHTTTNILSEKYEKQKIVPSTIIHEHFNDGVTLNEFYNTISNLLEILGHDRHMPLTGKKLTTTLQSFKTSISTYIQECCPDNKQHHIFGNQYYGNGLRLNSTQNYYRPNIFSSPDSWNWFSEDHTRWFPCCELGIGVRPQKSPSFIRYFKPSEIKSIPDYCKNIVIFYNKPALLGVRRLNRK